jgi:urease accessory protein
MASNGDISREHRARNGELLSSLTAELLRPANGFMASPFPSSSSAPGEGLLFVQLLPHDISGLKTITYQYPLKLISPSPSVSQKSVLVFLLTYGGGLVGGDQVNLRITVQSRAKLSLVTQGHTKIFKSASRDIVTRQRLDVEVASGAALCLLPDPVQPFDGSVYEQHQIFTLAEDASLCLLDWVCQGRYARGENWDCHSWSGRNEVWSTDENGRRRLLLRDNVKLDGDITTAHSMNLSKKMQGIGLFGTLILRGPQVEALADFFVSEFAVLPRIGSKDFRSDEAVKRDNERPVSAEAEWRRERLLQEKADGLLWTVAKTRGCTVVKFGARTVEGGRTWIGSMVKQEKSINHVFGEDALMCVK